MSGDSTIDIGIDIPISVVYKTRMLIAQGSNAWNNHHQCIGTHGFISCTNSLWIPCKMFHGLKEIGTDAVVRVGSNSIVFFNVYNWDCNLRPANDLTWFEIDTGIHA